jgi:hypothetical protein
LFAERDISVEEDKHSAMQTAPSGMRTAVVAVVYVTIHGTYVRQRAALLWYEM